MGPFRDSHPCPPVTRALPPGSVSTGALRLSISDTYGSDMEPMNHDAPQGLAVSDGTYTFAPSSTSLRPGSSTAFTFKITGKDGKPLKSYAVLHEKELHLVVVRRDVTGYQHLHPTRASSGTWSIPLGVASAGVYKAFASFQPTGQMMPMPVTLAVDLLGSGDFAAVALPEPSKTAGADGFEVRLAGKLTVGSSKLTFTVTRDGKPVEDLQPYLGAYGHLVALRIGDLAYLHVHPEEPSGGADAPGGPQIVFHAPVPTAGVYRLFLDFKVGDVVHTAEFTAPASRGMAM